jgi:hypothetical protein
VKTAIRFMRNFLLDPKTAPVYTERVCSRHFEAI